MNQNYRIENENITVQISPKGAELQSIYYAGNEYLWQGDTAYWKERAPNLFPWVGRLTNGAYTYQNKAYKMDIHGFVKDSILSVTSSTKTSILFTLESTPAILEQYPFNFKYHIEYKLQNNSLVIEYIVENIDNKTMYFAVGGHPGFTVPIAQIGVFEDYYLEFAAANQPKRILFSEENFVLGQEDFILQEKSKINLTHKMFEQDAIVLSGTGGKVILKSETAPHSITVNYTKFPYLGIWKMPGTSAPYVCLEPWSTLPAGQNVIENIQTKKDIISLPAKQVFTKEWSITLQ